MKILMLGHKRIPSREGGVEIVVEKLAVRMAEQGHDVTVYNRKGHHVSGKDIDKTEAKLKEYKNVRIVTIPTFQNGKLNALVYSFFASVKAVFGKYDIIHIHAEGSCGFMWFLKLFRKNTVVTIHGLDWQRAKWGGFATKYLLFCEKRAAKNAGKIIVLTKSIQEYFEKTYARKTICIPNGIEKVKPEKCSLINERYGIEKDGYILFLGRIVPEKGIEYLINAYMKLDTDKKLVIAGGSSHTDDYMKKIQMMAEKDERIIMTGFVQGKLLEELYSNAYIFVQPSDVEGMPISLLEAMSYGNCCVVSDIRENVETVEDKAIAFEKGNENDLRRALTELLEDSQKVKSYKENAGEYVVQKYNWDNVTMQTLAVYEELCSK